MLDFNRLFRIFAEIWIVTIRVLIQSTCIWDFLKVISVKFIVKAILHKNCMTVFAHKYSFHFWAEKDDKYRKEKTTKNWSCYDKGNFFFPCAFRRYTRRCSANRNFSVGEWIREGIRISKLRVPSSKTWERRTKSTITPHLTNFSLLCILFFRA